MKKSERERLLELLADKTLFGLSEEELMELRQLKDEFPDWEEDISLELTAAMIGLSGLDTEETLPDDLRAKIFANADDYFDPKNTQKVLSFPPKASQAIGSTAANGLNAVSEADPPSLLWQWLGWAVAAAACVALAINLWLTQPQKPSEIVKNPETIQTPAPEFSNQQKREQLIASASDTVQISLTDPKNEKEVLGDMVWSNSQQKGYARFRGLPANDVAKETYQLWIVDETQNEKTPISGGVFNVNGTGEITVPINAQLQVKKPKMIAVTKEKPGGVVVSKQEKVVAVAKI